MNKFGYIDSLRGLAILGVIIVHTAQSVPGLHPIIFNVCNYGKHGVQLFFFLSAYTLCLSRKGRESEPNANTKYFIRRFFRIAPLYYFGIIFYGIIFILKNNGNLGSLNLHLEYSVSNVLRHLTFTQSLSQNVIFGVVPGGWSIGTEMLFYLVFPFLFDRYLKIRSFLMQILLPIGIALFSFVFFRALPHLFPPLSKHDFNFYYCTLLNQIPIFLLGISFFVIANQTVFKLKIGWLSLIIFFIITFILLLIKYVNYNDISIFPFLAGCSFVFLFIAFKTISVLNLKLLQFIGRVSYSMYLFHFVFAWGISTYINSFFSNSLNNIFILVISIIISVFGSLVMASITKYLIEDRGIAMGSFIIKKIS